MRRPLIAGNWKMYKTIDESISFIKKLMEQPLPAEVDSVICAPFPALPALVTETQASRLRIGAQNVHWEKEGAYTGEVSVPMLKAMGVTYVIIGHSERRSLFAETDDAVNKKVHAALAGGLIPIICVGEELREREAGKTKTIVRSQVKAALEGVTALDAAQVVFAYEPVWAIGSGQAATADDAEEVCAFIRKLLKELYNEKVADRVRIQYGGSVKLDNLSAFLSKPNIDGALVGGASLAADSFRSLLQGAIPS